MNRSGREDREEEKEKGVGGRPQREIEKTVDQDAETARQCADRNAAAEMTVFGADFLQAPFEKQENKGRDADEPDNSGVRQNLQVIVMRLFDARQAACVIERRIGDGERPEPCAERHIRLDDLQRDGPDVGTLGRKIF